MRRLKALWQGQNSPPAQTADPAAITPSPAAQVVITPPSQQPGPMPPSSGVPQPHPPLKTSKTSPLASTPGAMSPSSGVPLHPSHKTSKTSPTASTERCHLPLASLDHIHTHQKKPGIFIFQRRRTPISHI